MLKANAIMLIEKIAAFVYANPHGFSHLIDLPYRLSSWSLEDPANLRLWETDGKIRAIGMLQIPWAELDYVYLPESEHLVPEIFTWAAERALAIAHETRKSFSLVIRIPPGRAMHIHHAKVCGFNYDDEWTIVHLQ